MYIPASNMDIQDVLGVMGVKNGVMHVETLDGSGELPRQVWALLFSHESVPFTHNKIYTLFGNPVIISYI